MDCFYERQLQLQKELRQEIDRLEARLSALPKGSLCRKTINGVVYLYWELYADGSGNPQRRRQVYLSSQDKTLISELREKALISKLLPKMQHNSKRLEKFLSGYQVASPEATLPSLPKTYRELPSFFMPSSATDKERAWLSAPFQQNPYHPELKIHGTSNGVKMRSKSEVLIGHLLELNQIPYRYEAELKQGNHSFYPDFTIFDSEECREIYWEHFGMVDACDYAVSMERKIINYAKIGICLWDNLIATFSFSTGPLDIQQVQRIIQVFLKGGKKISDLE